MGSTTRFVLSEFDIDVIVNEFCKEKKVHCAFSSEVSTMFEVEWENALHIEIAVPFTWESPGLCLKAADTLIENIENLTGKTLENGSLTKLPLHGIKKLLKRQYWNMSQSISRLYLYSRMPKTKFEPIKSECFEGFDTNKFIYEELLEVYYKLKLDNGKLLYVDYSY